MEVLMKSPIVLLWSLLDDVKRLHPLVRGIERDSITLNDRFKHEGLGFISKTLPSLCDAFDEGLSTGRFTCPSNFRKIRGGVLPRLFSGLLSNVFDRSTGELLSSADLGIVKTIREILRLFRKLQPNQDQDDRLDIEARQKFFECEDLIPRQLDERLDYRLRLFSRYILKDLSKFNPSDMVGKHGPGAVYEGYSPNQKWSGLLSSLDRLVNYGFDIFSYQRGLGSILSTEDELFFYTPPNRIARLCTVPKNISSKRTITVEPTEQQYVQGGLNIVLRDAISRCPILKQSLALSDQSKNQYLAMIGSQTDEWATIDLSSASDLLSNEVVRAVFSKHSTFLDAMYDCRSSHVEGFVPPLRKFAGMGNALTFPVQSIAFLLLGISGILRNQRVTYWSIKRAARNIRVYGDDIIVRREYAQAVCAELQLAGLIVNKRKSFLTGNFKESCGVDAFRGVDVTPLYVRYLSDSNLCSRAKELAHLVQLCNHSWLRGLYSMSTCIRNDIEERFGYLPLGHSESGHLCYHTHQNVYSYQRYDKHLHRPLIKAPVVYSSNRKDRLDGYGALLKFFHTCRTSNWVFDSVETTGRGKRHLERTDKRHMINVAWRWVPAR
jgi:hypothetical protein